MSKNKVYYWMRLNEDFFDDDTVDWVLSQEGGAEYLVLYLKLCLSSLRDSGLLVRVVGGQPMPYDAETLARKTRMDVSAVRTGLALFQRLGLIATTRSGALKIERMNELAGSETAAAIKKRRQRERLSSAANNAPEESSDDEPTETHISEEGGQCPPIVPRLSSDCPPIVPPRVKELRVKELRINSSYEESPGTLLAQSTEGGDTTETCAPIKRKSATEHTVADAVKWIRCTKPRNPQEARYTMHTEADGWMCAIPQDWVDQWEAVYGNVDILKTLDEILQKQRDANKYRKTPAGTRRFCGSWLHRENDRIG